MATKVNLQPPDLNECKSYEAYKRQLKAWADVTDLPKGKQGNYVVLALPNKSKFGDDLKERALETCSEEDLKSETGLAKVIKFLDDELGKNAVDDIIDKWEEFDNCKKQDSQSLDEFISEFESKYNRIKLTGTKLPEEILAYMLMRRANLTHIEKMLILSRVDIEKKDDLFKNVKVNMKNILGKRLQEKEKVPDKDEIRLEAAFLAEQEEVLAAHGYYRSRSNTFPKNKTWNKGFKKPEYSKKVDKSGRPINPKGKDGQPMLCKSCGSFRHFVEKCPDSHENKGTGNIFLTEDVEDNSEVERYVLFTSDREEISKFTSEAINSAALDTCCTTTVAGKNWINIYLESLPDQSKELVKGPLPSLKTFKGVNQGTLPAIAKFIIPAEIGENAVMIEVDIVDADIPLLLSKSAMKKAKMVLHMDEDYAEILGKPVSLNTTSAGHYVIPLLTRNADKKINEDQVFHFEEIFAVDFSNADPKEKETALIKLHKQFGHRPKESFINLLKSAEVWTPDMTVIIDHIIDGCEGCIKRRRNPDKPAVSMPMATVFNEKLAVDLSFYKGIPILHMIDMHTRLTVSAQLKRKKPSEVIDQIMKRWIAYFGFPGAILNDKGGEFTADEVRDVKAMLNVTDLTTAAESPWQNGLCEKNHAMIDTILERLDEDFPDLDLDSKLAWAGMAKNSLQMVYGFSPNQLVFGNNPKLPNILSDGPPAWESSTASEMLVKHMNLLHASRKAFLKSESCSKLKIALKAKITCSETLYEPGDVVYYKRARDGKWMGPAKVVFQDGKIIFVRSGSAFVRVSANRIIKAGTELSKKVNAESRDHDVVQSQVVNIPPVSNNGQPQVVNIPPVEGKEMQSNKTPCFTFLDQEEVNVREQEHPAAVVDELAVNAAAEPQERAANNQPHPPQNAAREKPQVIRKDDRVRMLIEDNWVSGTIAGRAGRATGKYKEWYNVNPDDGSEPQSVDLGTIPYQVINHENRDLEGMPGNGEQEEVLLTLIPKKEQNNAECDAAKSEELQKLKDFNTYIEVSDVGQDAISSTWVITKKNGQMKGRLVARGFEDETETRTDSPTMSKTAFRVLLTMAASKQWEIETTDIKSAFLQGQDLDRDVFLIPPKEANALGKLWKLLKGLYGLKEACRLWYSKVKQSLLKNGCEEVVTEPGLFLKKDLSGKTIGAVGVHVDDFLHAGDSQFQKEVIDKIHAEFKVGKNEKSHFMYTGFQLTQHEQGVLLDQNQYLCDMEIPEISSERCKEKYDPLTESEKTNLRKMAGTLNWVVRGTRPDLSFQQIDASTSFKDGIVGDLIKVRKTLVKLKENKAEILFPNLGTPMDWIILCFTDAAFGNLGDGVSSTGAHIVFLVNRKSGYCSTLDWQANKIKRVVRSTLAAETLSLCDGLENSLHIREIIQEFTDHSVNLPVFAIVDNLSVTEAVRSSTSVSDKRLRREVGLVKELLKSGQVSKILWAPGKEQLADVMTKLGVDGSNLLHVLQSGYLDLAIYK